MATDDASPISAEDGPWNKKNGELPRETSSTALVLPGTPAQSNRQRPETGTSSRAAVAVACVACRSRHLKCDGGVRCSRCIAEGINCSYVKSRRGWKGPRRPARQSLPQNDLSSVVSTQVSVPQSVFGLPTTFDTFPRGSSCGPQNVLETSPAGVSFSLDVFSGPSQPSQVITVPPPTSSLIVDASSAGLVGAYYSYFHPAHPFLLPHSQILELFNISHIPHLELGLQYIGSLYVASAPTAKYQESLQQSLSQDGVARDGVLVQAMLLFAIGLHICDQEEQSATVMRSTITLAQELGMDKRDFAIQNGENSALMEEIWRRTWWELFVLDGMFAGVNPEYTLQLSNIKSEVDLPCEESDFVSGLVPPILKNLTDYDDAVFIEDEICFSSSTYRIDAVRLLQKVFNATRSAPLDSQLVDAADVHLKNWALHLPPTKRSACDRNGNVDEVLFEAHMIVSACTIILHRPRSDLSLDDVREVTTCVGAYQSPLPGNYKDVHTAKAMQAARDISKLITLPCPLIKHTPFFSCAVTMASIVFLSYWSFIATESGDAFIKENIRLNIGVLKTLGELWPIANTVLGQVKGVAKELFESRKALNNAYSHAVTREEIFQGMIESIDPTSDDQSLYCQYLTLP